MKIYNIKNMTLGWFIGDFDPSVYKNKDFEVGYKIHLKNEKYQHHYHKTCTEINFVIDGKMIMHGIEINSGDIFVLEPYEIANQEFLNDTKIICIKIPSSPDDKVLI